MRQLPVEKLDCTWVEDGSDHVSFSVTPPQFRSSYLFAYVIPSREYREADRKPGRVVALSVSLNVPIPGSIPFTDPMGAHLLSVLPPPYCRSYPLKVDSHDSLSRSQHSKCFYSTQ